MNFFIFDNVTNSLRIDEHAILLIKEFNALWDPSRNKCKKDSTGINRLRAYKELTYIYLTLDWKSPYFQYLEQDKHEAALLDSGLTDDDLKDQVFKAAYNKYEEIQNADRVLSLIRTSMGVLYKTEIHLDNIDFNERDDNGKPIYKPADVIKDLKGIAQMRTELLALEIEHKKGLLAQNKVRGDNTPGFQDM